MSQVSNTKASNAKVWKTKYGPRRVRHDPPTLEEAIFAARGLTDDINEQVEIAASLMEATPEQVRAAMTKLAPQRKTATVTFTGRAGGHRAVVVERKVRRPMGTRSFG